MLFWGICSWRNTVQQALHSSSNRSSTRWPLLPETRWDLIGDPGLKTPHQILVSSGLWVGNYRHSYVSTHFKLWPRQLKIERPRSAVTPFFFFPQGMKTHTHAHLFSIFPPPFLFLYKELRPPSHNSVPPFLCGQDRADGSWHGGGIVLTVELMWPQGCHVCMLGWVWPNTMQSASLWEEVQGTQRRIRTLRTTVWR